MSQREIVRVVEIDVDYCDLTFGVLPCNAALGDGVLRKCYNTFDTCPVKQVFQKGVKTLRFVEPTFPIKASDYIPALIKVGGYEQEVNIAGYSPNIGGLGKRASVSVTLEDFPSRDVLTDKYWRERMDGTAQINEPGYDPYDRGSFWSKFKARNPNYAGRELRVIQGYVNDDRLGITPIKTRSYIMSEFDGPDDNGTVTITAKDILALADDPKAQCPQTSRGKLSTEISEEATEATLAPAGIGNEEYPANGFAVIGSEIVGFTRTGDSLSLMRGQKGTVAAKHNADDTFQLAFDVNEVRGDETIRRLLVNFAKIDPSYIPFADWQAEFDKWGSQMIFTTTICKPTSVRELLSEINQLGITLWWDEVAKKIRLKLNHPPEEDVYPITDRDNIIRISQDDNDDERITRIAMWTVQIDPTKALNKDNFLRGDYSIFVDGEHPNMFNQETTKTIYCRWFNKGNNNIVKITTGRILNRYKSAPSTYNVKVDIKDDLSLTDVVELDSYIHTDVTGKSTPRLTQVFYRADDEPGSTVNLKLQKYQYEGNYGVFTENTRPVYGSSSPEQKEKGTYWVGPSLVFSDGRKAYQFI